MTSEDAPRRPPSTSGAKVLAVIRDVTTERGYPPSIADIADACGFRSRGTVQAHLRVLARDGWIRRDPGVSRGIVLLDPTDTKETDK